MEKNYEIRNEIEQIVKEKQIDRRQFHEVSKLQYESVMQKLYYSFFDYQKYEWLIIHCEDGASMIRVCDKNKGQ